ncbi:MAG: secretion system protein [Siphoviridae sp. ctjeG17]|nr:MAG: secretion system protein [Siphoviridae sp. ctjeG17]
MCCDNMRSSPLFWILVGINVISLSLAIYLTMRS